MVKRAVITGMGVVSPNGIGKDEFCRAILAGKSGVKRITRFDVSNLPVQIAGEITDFEARCRRNARQRRRSAGIQRGAVSALLPGNGEAGELVQHPQRHNGHALQRDQHALWFSRVQPRLHYRLHFVD